MTLRRDGAEDDGSGVLVITVSMVPANRVNASVPAIMRDCHPVPGEWCDKPLNPAAPPFRAQLAVVGLHVTVEFPRIVWNLDVDRRQTALVPLGFAAHLHGHLPSPAEQSCGAGVAPRPTRRVAEALPPHFPV